MHKNNIKALRLERGMTLFDVAKSLDVAQSTISWWESGRYEPSISNSKKLADLFGVTMEELLEESK